MSEVVIKLHNIDSYIPNLEDKMIPLIKACQSDLPIVIKLDYEGPCAKSLGLYNLLDKLCQEFQVDPNRITIHTANPLENHPVYKIVKGESVWLGIYRRLEAEDVKLFDSDLKHFGIFIGRSNWNRLFLASTIFKDHKEKSLVSFHYNVGPGKDNGLSNLVHWFTMPGALELVTPLLNNFPLILDKVNRYPVRLPEHLNILKFYKNIFLDVVCETYFTGNTFFPTEKTVRPLVTKTPFLVFGPIGYLANLRKLGFKTFGDFWCEEYDKYDSIYRAQEMVKIIEDLSKLSTEQLETMYTDMLPILEHNKNNLREITATKFFETFKNE